MQGKGRYEKAAKPAPAKSRSLPVPSSPEGGNGNNSGRSPGFRIVPPSPGLPESPTRPDSETLRIQRTSDHDLETTQTVPANRPSIYSSLSTQEKGRSPVTVAGPAPESERIPSDRPAGQQRSSLPTPASLLSASRYYSGKHLKRRRVLSAPTAACQELSPAL